MPLSSDQLHNPAPFHHLPHLTVLTIPASGNPTKEHPYASFSIAPDNLLQHLRAAPIHACHTMDIKDNVLITVFLPQSRQSGVGLVGSVAFQSSQSGLEFAGVGKRQWFGDLYDQTAIDELQAVWRVREEFCVFEPVGARDATQDLDAWPGSVADDL